MNRPLVSVVVPVYNVEEYLEKCLYSIINQTYSNLEIILVDDGSTDKCPYICDVWEEKDSRIKVIHKSNNGLGMARNTGLEKANGKYIFFFDSDDYIDITLVEKCVVSAENTNADVIIFGRYDVYENGRIERKEISNRTILFKDDTIKNKLLPYMFTYELGFGVSVWGKMYRLNTVKDLNLHFVSEREIISEDAYFALELYSKISTVAVVPESLYFYCKHGNSLSRRYNKDRQAQNDVFLTKSMEFLDNAGLPDKVSAHIKARYHGLTLGTMMQIVSSDLSKKEKKIELNKIYRNQLLEETLTKEVCRLDARLPRIFWMLLKNKCYLLCTFLLYCNKNR